MAKITTAVSNPQRYGGRSDRETYTGSLLTAHLFQLVSELPFGGHDHGDAILIGRFDDLSVPH
jgi:hypothetical protein